MLFPDQTIRRFLCACALSILWSTFGAGESQTEEKVSDNAEPVLQPIPFDHRLHSSLQLECISCHPGAEEQASAGLPDADLCLQCHESLQKESPVAVRLKELASTDLPIEWIRLYRVPYFVFFSHSSHAKAGVACGECHGDVADQEVLRSEKEMSMLFCVDCHKTSGASAECHLCHELSQ